MQSAVHHALHPSLEFLHVVDALGLDELGPGGDFFASRLTRISKGSAKGFSAAPRNICGRTFISKPLSSFPSSRIILTVCSSCVESRSNTLAAVDDRRSFDDRRSGTADYGYRRRRPQNIALHADAVAVAGGHLQHRLQPHLFDADARARLHWRTTAVWLSVTLMAST